MNQFEMLQRMCQVLAGSDLKAIVKARGLPVSAANPGILVGLFLTEQGVAAAFHKLEPAELAVLHLLKAIGKPVPVSFFTRAYSAQQRSYGTFTQRHHNVFAKIMERLVRGGVLLMFDVRGYGQQAKMELWRFVLPVEFQPHLPPLLPSPRTFAGSGNCRPDATRDKLRDDLCGAKPAKKNEATRFQIVEGELRLGDSGFRRKQVPGVQDALWIDQLAKKPPKPEENSLEPTEAVANLLGTLAENEWADAEQLTELAGAFTGRKVDCGEVCEAGWQIGRLAKHDADGKSWFRLASPQPPRRPHEYLRVLEGDGGVSVDLEFVPLSALETVAALSNVRLAPGDGAALLLQPNLVRIGRADAELLASEEAAWLFAHSPAFQQARATHTERRGQTVLHNDVLIARVTDLSLKLALEKALGESLVSLKNDYIVFPYGSLGDVQRIVKKSGHVIKEVAAS